MNARKCVPSAHGAAALKRRCDRQLRLDLRPTLRRRLLVAVNKNVILDPPSGLES